VARRSRRKHGGAFKAKVAVEAIQGVKTVPEIARRHEVHPSQVNAWKKQALEGLPSVFETEERENTDKLVASLYEQVGRLQVELQWLKKKSGVAD
jgi:transposase-like protein